MPLSCKRVFMVCVRLTVLHNSAQMISVTKTNRVGLMTSVLLRLLTVLTVLSEMIQQNKKCSVYS